MKGLLALFALLFSVAAVAHGDHDPKYGGIIGHSSDEVIVELVVEDGAVFLYIEEETGTPIPSAKVSGTLTLIPAQRPRQEAKLVPAGGNKLAAPGLKPSRGDRLRAYIRLPNGDELSSSFLFAR